jgi:hypothetical protein
MNLSYNPLKINFVLKKQYHNIGAKGFDFNIKSMFFEDSSRIEQQIHTSLHLVYSNSS